MQKVELTIKLSCFEKIEEILKRIEGLETISPHVEVIIKVDVRNCPLPTVDEAMKQIEEKLNETIQDFHY